jgi:hypothetical protein
MNRLHVFVVFLCGMMLASCSKRLTPFTHDLYRDYNWSERELNQIQFYLSSDILLWRNVDPGQLRVDGGKIKVRRGRRFEEIRFRRGTPGRLVFFPETGRLGISFEQGNDDSFLMFGPSPKTAGRYTLLAKEWGRNEGLIRYGRNEYYTGAQSAFTHLMIDMQVRGRTRTSRSTVRGRRN